MHEKKKEKSTNAQAICFETLYTSNTFVHTHTLILVMVDIIHVYKHTYAGIHKHTYTRINTEHHTREYTHTHIHTRINIEN